MDATDIDLLRACARDEEAFAATGSFEPNPWEGSMRRLKEAEGEIARQEQQTRGNVLQRALAEFRRVTIAIARLREDKVANGVAENAKRATPAIVRWNNAGRVADSIGVYHAWSAYAAWVVSGRTRTARSVAEYPQPNWLSQYPEIVFEDDASRAEIMAWRELQVQGSLIQSQIDSAEAARAKLLAHFPSLAVVHVEIPSREPEPSDVELVGAA
jgi:hypothetical protein